MTDDFDRDLAHALRTIKDDYGRESAPFRIDARRAFLKRYRVRRRNRMVGAIAFATAAVVVAIGFLAFPRTADEGFDPAEGPKVELPNATTIALQGGPVDLATADEGFVWASEAANGTVARVDVETNTVAGRTNIGARPGDIALGLNAVWVAEPALGRVAMIDPADGVIVKTINVATGPVADIEITVGAGHVWALSEGEGLAQISPGGMVTNTLEFKKAIDVAVRDRVWLLDSTGAIHVLHPETLQESATIDVPAAPNGDITFGNDSLWYGTRLDGTLLRLDRTTGETLGTVSLRGVFSKLAIDTTNAWALSLDDEGGGWLTPLDRSSARPLGAPIALEADPVEPALGEGSLWVAETSANLLLRLPKAPQGD